MRFLPRFRPPGAVLALAAGLIATLVLPVDPAHAQWSNRMSYQGWLDDMLPFQGNLYVVGGFGGERYARGFGQNESWFPMAGLDGSFEKRLAVHDGSLYASSEDLYVLIGTTWVLRWDAPHRVTALTSHRDTLVVCLASPEGEPCLYRPEGSGWVPYLPDDKLGLVACMASYGGDLYLAGGLTRIGPRYVRGIARWDGVAWHRLGAGADNGTVLQFAFHDGKLVVLGSFTSAGSHVTNGLAWWDGAAWGTFGGSPGPTSDGDAARIYGATSYGNDLVIGGRFDAVNGVPAEGVAVWRDNRWYAAPYPGGLREGGSLATFRQAVWGEIDISHPDPNHVAKWTGQVTGLGEDEVVPPRPIAVSPNPFRGATTVTIDSPGPPRAAHILDVRGRLVRRLDLPPGEAGPVRISWDGRSEDGVPVPSGVYFLRVELPHGNATARLLRLR